ncbi:MAG: response regulator [Elusimicrobia bacterium]|nr:response regulator [Elusimicrobiota bacterium]
MSGRAIVVIDDDEAIRDACRQTLGREAEYRVSVAEDGPSGIEEVKRAGADLALVDLKLPGMDGMEVLAAIAKACPEVVCVVITGYPTIASAVEAMKRGAYDFLPKPFTPDELRVVVKRALDKGRLEAETRALWQERAAMQREFVNLAAHELRAPLNAVQQFADAILAGTAGELNPKQREVIGRMRERVAGLRGVVDHWLDINRLQSGRLSAEMKPIRLGALVEEAADVLGPAARARRIRVNVEGWEEDALVVGDRQCLKEMVINLLDNGIKYNKPGGEVTLKLSRPVHGKVKLEVTDTGVGIPEHEIPFVFEEFFRGEACKGSGVDGTGLGLTLVGKIVQLHQGAIGVSSRVGEGSVFTVDLPVADQQRRSS